MPDEGVNSAAVRAKVEGRTAARQFVELMDEEYGIRIIPNLDDEEHEDEHFARAFWQTLIEVATDRLDDFQVPEPEGPVPEVDIHIRPMTDQELEAMDRKEVSFGQFRGKAWKDVPASYLAWLADQQLDVLRYVYHPRIRRELENEQED